MKQPRYPVYIISKGRAESRHTSRTLEECKIDYKIVIEENEYDAYSAVIDPKKILTLPLDFREDPRYAIKDNNGLCGGSIPVRNFVWEHSKSLGYKRHWVLDDNFRYFFRSHQNTRLRCYSSAPLCVIEDFVDRFENIRLAGPNYNFFVPANIDKVMYYMNTRVYSCILIDNSITHRWRGKFNEDTDLSLRVLRDGDCTVMFNSFNIGKAATLTMKGGNTEEIYQLNKQGFDNRYEFAKSLKDHHPDVVEVTNKWGRWHHQVDYGKYTNNHPIPKPGLVIPTTNNEYGLRLVKLKHRKTIEPEVVYDENIDNISELITGVE